MSNVNRRLFLKTMGSAVVASSFENLLRMSMANAAGTPGPGMTADGYPLRFISIYHPHCAYLDFWRPRTGWWDPTKPGSGMLTNQSINYNYSSLAALDKYRDRLVVMEGVDFKVLVEKGNGGHGGGPCSFLTGSATQFIPGTTMRDGDFGSARPDNPTMPSLDLYLADSLGVNRSKTAQLSVGYDGGTTASQTISYDKNGVRCSAMGNPATYYAQIAKGLVPAGTGGNTAAQFLLNKRMSVLDFATKDINRLLGRVGAVEKAKLDAHMTAIRGIENRLTTTAGSTTTGGVAACSALTANGANNYINFYGPTSGLYGDEITHLQMDVLAEAIRCDLTRFASFMIAPVSDELPNLTYQEPDGITYKFKGKNIHNDIAHQVGWNPHPLLATGNTETTARRALGVYVNWVSQHIAYLMDKLAAMPEGNGTALDHTVFLWGSEMGNPSLHDSLSIPLVIIGSADGYFQTGRYLNFQQYEYNGGLTDYLASPCPQGSTTGCSPYNDRSQLVNSSYDTPHNQVLTSICNAFGVPNTYFGDPKYTGVLPGLKKGT